MVNVPSLLGSTAFLRAYTSCSLGKSLADRISFALFSHNSTYVGGRNSVIPFLVVYFVNFLQFLHSNTAHISVYLMIIKSSPQIYINSLDIISEKTMNPIIKSILLCLLVTMAVTHKFPELEITKVDKVIQLNTALLTQIDKIEYKCLAEDCGDELLYALTQSESQKVSSIQFSKDKQQTGSLRYTTQPYQHNGEKFVLYKVNPKRSLLDEQTYTLVVSTIYLNRYINYPTSIELTEDQKFEYEDNRNYLSPYPVRDGITTYKFTKIINFAQDGEKKGLSSVAFRYSDLKPFNYVSHRVHGVNNEPQVYFSEVVREIEVSHWGNIAITEFYKIKNIGPELKGEFSRVQFSSNNRFEAKNAWKGIETELPYQIWGLYYRDQVGNISTSRAYKDDRNAVVKVGLAPRYALLGGWKANWEIGYNLHTDGFLTHDGNQYELNKIPIQYALSSILAEKYTIRLILPEGSTNVQLSLGGEKIQTSKISHGVSFGYLDFSGRPTFTIENLKGLPKDQKLKVSYNYEYLSLFKKPLIVFGAIFSILVLLIVVKRLNMSAFEQKHHVKTN